MSFSCLYNSFDSCCEGQSPKLFYFNAVKEGQSVDFAAENENERTGWITALVRATGQSYRPEPPTRYCQFYCSPTQFNQPQYFNARS